MKALLRKFGLARFDPVAEALYRAAILEGRRELYYADWGVPDTMEGRFDMISLMVSLINRRIGLVDRRFSKQIQTLAQELFDVMFADIDLNLREMGVSDEGMKYKIKPMASAHLGRVKAYTDCLVDDGEEGWSCLQAALARNVYRTEKGADTQPLARRVQAIARALSQISDEDVLAGRLSFPDMP